MKETDSTNRLYRTTVSKQDGSSYSSKDNTNSEWPTIWSRVHLFKYQTAESSVRYMAKQTAVFPAASAVAFFFSSKYSGIRFLLCSKTFSISKSECKDVKTLNLQNTEFLFVKSALSAHYFESENYNPEGPLEMKAFQFWKFLPSSNSEWTSWLASAVVHGIKHVSYLWSGATEMQVLAAVPSQSRSINSQAICMKQHFLHSHLIQAAFLRKSE